MTRQFAEELESRCLLSAVGPASIFDPAVRADEKAVYTALKQFKTHGLKDNRQMFHVAQQIKKENLSQAPTVKTELGIFEGALVEADELLVGDNLAESGAVKNDERAILAEQKKLARDKNNSTAESADAAQLVSDRQQVQSDLISEVNTRVSDRENIYNQILNEASTVVGGIQADTQASTKLQSLGNQLNTDATQTSTALSDDLEQLNTAATQLDTDLTASQSQQ